MTMSQTNFTITNNWNEPVKVYLTLGVGTGFMSDINNVSFIETVTNPHQGYFMLDPGAEVSYMPPQGEVFSGNVCFNSPPINCPTPDFPLATNLGEFTLNIHTLNSDALETIDISNVAGANAFMKYTLTGGGTWNAGPTEPTVTSFENKALGKNVGQVGVYPYACDDCTASVAPPQCSLRPEGAPFPPVPQKHGICNVQRASSGQGGTVALSYEGPIPYAM